MNLFKKTNSMTHATPIIFQKHADANGVLCVFESGQQVPFEIMRVFTVSAAADDTRGDHAHKKCTQLLVCVSGIIHVTCDDGTIITEHILDNMGVGLLVPPGVWAKETYVVNNAVLMVLCDRGFEAEDYIRDYDDFKKFVTYKE
jgi:dTDP-4-dehydrorhamnose 3,5-epimerase-like enzyme